MQFMFGNYNKCLCLIEVGVKQFYSSFIIIISFEVMTPQDEIPSYKMNDGSSMDVTASWWLHCRESENQDLCAMLRTSDTVLTSLKTVQVWLWIQVRISSQVGQRYGSVFLAYSQPMQAKGTGPYRQPNIYFHAYDTFIIVNNYNNNNNKTRKYRKMFLFNYNIPA